MRRTLHIAVGVICAAGLLLISGADGYSIGKKQESIDDHCFIGVFMADGPVQADIEEFQKDYGKKPYFVMMFVDWEKYPDPDVMKDMLSEGCTPVITWEPWEAASRTPVNYDGLLAGEYDDYIVMFAGMIRSYKKDIFIRFAHEMNGDWYPWSGASIGSGQYKELYRYIKNIFDREKASNAMWVFSINWEDMPPVEDNEYMCYYPGDEYVDYVGIDGYNWGNAVEWGRWMSFEEIFGGPIKKVKEDIKKPILISEFGSTSQGGDKTKWIKDAMNYIKSSEQIKGFILFNVDKETDWSFPVNNSSGREFKNQIKNAYFRGAVE